MRFSAKNLVIALALVFSFMVGYGTTVLAYPPSPYNGVGNRAEHRGYFTNSFDPGGTDVLPVSAAYGGNALPTDINNANEFIHYIKVVKLNGNAQERTGAAFIIHTMIGSSTVQRHRPPNASQLAEWEARVRYAEHNGNIQWYRSHSYAINSYYQGPTGGGATNDDAFYDNNGTATSIVFFDDAGHIKYALRRQCANPVGNVQALQDDVNFNLIPTASTPTTTAQEGDTITFTYRVQNTGSTNAPNIYCRVAGNIQPPGYVPLPQQDVTRASDPGFVAPDTGCPRTINANSTVTLVVENFVVPDSISPGDKVCRSLIVDPRASGLTPPVPRASAEVCVTIAKAPYVHFQGNDVWAGGNFTDIDPTCFKNAKIQTIAAKSLSDGSYAGSAVEYAAFALGQVMNFGSASKAYSGFGDFDAKQLIFANTDPSEANLGFYGAPQHCINDYTAQFSEVATTSLPADIDVADRGSGVYRISGNHTFSGTMPAGSRQVYIVDDGDVTINSNLSYPASYDSLGDIPSLVIIVTGQGSGGNIRVHNNATTLDGLFVAKNRFITCILPGGNLSVTDCDNKLTINGAVVAGFVEFNRTAGASGSTPADRKEPGELFNFSAEFYLRNALRSSSNDVIRTMDVRELPPRF